MMTFQTVADLPAGAVRSRFIIPQDDQRQVAEVLLESAAFLAAEGVPYGQLRLFESLSDIARPKGFRHTAVLLSLVRQAAHSTRVRALCSEFVDVMGGPGDFLDAIDLITWPDEGCTQ